MPAPMLEPKRDLCKFRWLAFAVFQALLGLCSFAQEKLEDPWTPSPELLTEAGRLLDPGEFESWGAPETWTKHQIEVLRAGIRLPAGSIARQAALLLDYEWLDHFEQQRVVDLLIAEACRSADEDFESFRFCLGADDVPALFREMSSEPKSERSFFLGKIHVILRSEQVLLGLPWLQSSDPRLRHLSYETLFSPLGYDDSYRNEIAATLTEVLDLSPDEQESGLNSHLVALLRYVIVEEADYRAAPELEPYHAILRNWLLRWLGDSQPSATDLAFLIELSEKFRSATKDDAPPCGTAALMAALNRCDSPGASDVIEFWRDQGANSAIAILAHRGDAMATKLAITTGPRDLEFLVALLAFAPEVAVAVIRQTIAQGPKARYNLESLFRDFKPEVANARLDWSAAPMHLVRRDLEVLAARKPLQALSLAVVIPDCLSESLVDTVLLTLTERAEKHPELAFKRLLGSNAGVAVCRQWVGVLEALRPAAFRQLMSRWARTGSAVRQDFGCAALLRFGDPAAGALLIRYLERRQHRVVSDLGYGLFFAADVDPLACLALSPGPEVTAYLEERSLAGRAVLGGVPLELALWLGASDSLTALAPVQELIDADDWQGALALAMQSLEIEDWPYLPQSFRGLNDDRIKAFLHRVQDQRETGRYTWATGQLSLMGDQVARDELWRGIKAGGYGWLEDLNEEILTNGYDPATMSYWIDELKTQCCRINTSSGTVMDLIQGDIGWPDPAQSRLMTSFEFASIFYAPQTNRRLFWSDFLHEFNTVITD